MIVTSLAFLSFVLYRIDGFELWSWFFRLAGNAARYHLILRCVDVSPMIPMSKLTSNAEPFGFDVTEESIATIHVSGRGYQKHSVLQQAGNANPLSRSQAGWFLCSGMQKHPVIYVTRL